MNVSERANCWAFICTHVKCGTSTPAERFLHGGIITDIIVNGWVVAVAAAVAAQQHTRAQGLEIASLPLDVG